SLPARPSEELENRATCAHLVNLSNFLELDLGYYNGVTKFVYLKKREPYFFMFPRTMKTLLG
ncbi:hypothetical protein BpHYR1_000530, partial [Brachionus plicatilis]